MREDREKERNITRNTEYNVLYSKRKIGIALDPSQRPLVPSEWYRDQDELALILSFARHVEMKGEETGGTKSTNITKILDVGCGAGRLAIPIANSGISVVGIDSSSSGVKLAHEHDRRGLADFVVADMYHLPFRREIFDTAIVSGTFEYAQELSRPLREISTVLRRSGGKVYFHLWNNHGVKFRKLIRPDILGGKIDKSAKYFELNEIERQVEVSGMKMKSVGGLFFLLPLDVRQACSFMRYFKMNGWVAAKGLYLINRVLASSKPISCCICPVIWVVGSVQTGRDK